MKKILILILILFVVNVKALDQSIYNFSSGVDASVVKKTFTTNIDNSNDKESFILTSNTGIYIKNEDSYRQIKTIEKPVDAIVIEDINKDNYKDIVYAVNSKTGQYNLVAVSGKEDKILWTKVIQEKRSTYDRNLYGNINIYKIKEIEGNIVIISDYSIYVLNSKTGDLIFKYKDKDNIWSVTGVKDINKNKNSEIAITNQLGEVKLLDSKTGKVLWSNKITDDIKITLGEKKYTVKQNVWQVEFINNNLYAMGENGTLYLLDYKTGKIKDKLNLYETEKKILEQYYSNEFYPNSSEIYPTGKKNEFFNNFEMEVKKDKIIVKAFFNSLDRKSNYSLDPRVIVVDIKDFKVLHDIEVTNLKLTNIEPLDMDTYFLVPINIKNGSITIAKYDYELKSKVSESNVYIGTFINPDNKNKIYMLNTKGGVLIEQVNQFSVLLNDTYSKVLTNINTYSSLEIINVSNDGFIASYKTNGIVYKIAKFNNLYDTEPSWEYTIPTDFNNSGLFSIEVRNDFNKDGKKDIVALLNKLDSENNAESTYFLTINSINGNVINFKNIKTGSYVKDGKTITTYFIGSKVESIKDITRDNVPELLVDSNIINGANISMYGYLNSFLDVQASKLFNVGDINSDSIEDIIAVEAGQAFLFTSKISGNMIAYTKSNKKLTYSKDVLNVDYATTIPDLNKDGIDELVINDKKDNKQIYRIISGKDLSEMFIIDNINYYGSLYTFLNDDINNDGYNDFVENISTDNYNFISGKDGSSLYKIEVENEKDKYMMYEQDMMVYEEGTVMFNYMPNDRSVIVGSDINKDGTKEIFLLKEEYYPQQKKLLNMYDITKKDNKPIRTVEIFQSNGMQDFYRYDMEYNESYYSKSITEVINGDGLFLIKPQGNTSIIYDANSNKILSEINNYFIQAMKVKENIIFGVGQNKNPLMIDYSNDFKVKNIKEKTTYKSPLTIKLNNSDKENLRVINVYNKGVLLATEYDDQFDLMLKKGDYNLVFKATDVWGKTQNLDIDITIKKNNPYIIVSLFILFGICVLLVYLSIGHKLKRKNYLRRVYGQHN